MLELKSYTKPEITAMLTSKSVQALKRKLDRYNVEYEVCGRGKKAIFTIKKINNSFKLYCIMRLGIDAATDFKKLRNFYYLYFNDELFRTMPDEVKEDWLDKIDKHISRQSIAKYTQHLERNELIDRRTENFIYYFAYDHEQRFVDKNEYLKAWHEYWDDMKKYDEWGYAIWNMICNYGGVARKQAIPNVNVLHNEEIEYLLDLIQEDILKENQKN